MAALDNSVPNDPLEVPEPSQSESFTLEEGTVYGETPAEPKEAPDIDLLFEGADLPGGRSNALPFSLEWYAGAKERQRLRDIERERLDARRIELRGEWTRLMEEDIHDWIKKVDATMAHAGDASRPQDALSGLAELVARAAQEGPDDEYRNARLMEALAWSDKEDEILNRGLVLTRGSLQTSVESILQAEQDAIAEDERHAEEKRLKEERRARAQEQLKRQEALLRGEDPESLAATTVSESAALPPLKPGSAGLAGSPTRPPPLPPEEVSAKKMARGGSAMELPPLQDPPRPGSSARPGTGSLLGTP